MFEVRFHGRGGQGAVMAAQAFAEAAVIEGLEAQAFPFFGAERRGAPVRAFARIDVEKIRIKSQIYQPDMVVILDESLLEIDPVGEGLRPEGSAVVNTRKAPEEVDLGVSVRCAVVDATAVALEHIKAPIVNTSILGSMAKVQDLVSLRSIKTAIADRFGERLGPAAAEINAAAAQASFDRTKVGTCMGKREFAHREMWLPDWQDIPIGVTLPSETFGKVNVGPGSSWQNMTGTWRTNSPHYLKEKCIRCLRCWFSCPEGCIHRLEDDYEKWDFRYCKGCGVCAQVCPVSAIEMVKGVKEW
jgi:pyruvate ferredoxin oxidoreductase gamma subunit